MPRNVRKSSGPIDHSKPYANDRHEAFVQLLFTAKESQTDSYRRVFPASRKWKPESVWTKASKLADTVRPRLIFLQQQATDASIATMTECKQVLTEIIRGRITQFGKMGAAGFVPNVGPESQNSAALEEVTSRIEFGGKGDGKSDAVITKIKLRGIVPAIDMLAKLTPGAIAPTRISLEDILGQSNGIRIITDTSASKSYRERQTNKKGSK